MKIDNRTLEQYVTAAPDPQNAVDIFKGAWSSRLPAPYAGIKAGNLPLFEDVRIDGRRNNWAALRAKRS
ncbi:MAG: hypothetical protein R2911_11805 [Caldilineaceae bacterium]